MVETFWTSLEHFGTSIVQPYEDLQQSKCPVGLGVLLLWTVLLLLFLPTATGLQSVLDRATPPTAAKSHNILFFLMFVIFQKRSQ